MRKKNVHDGRKSSLFQRKVMVLNIQPVKLVSFYVGKKNQHFWLINRSLHEEKRNVSPVLLEAISSVHFCSICRCCCCLRCIAPTIKIKCFQNTTIISALISLAQKFCRFLACAMMPLQQKWKYKWIVMVLRGHIEIERGARMSV